MKKNLKEGGQSWRKKNKNNVIEEGKNADFREHRNRILRLVTTTQYNLLSHTSTSLFRLKSQGKLFKFFRSFIITTKQSYFLGLILSKSATRLAKQHYNITHKPQTMPKKSDLY